MKYFFKFVKESTLYKVIASKSFSSAAVSSDTGEFGISPISGSFLSSGEDDRVVNPLEMELFFDNGLGDDVVYLAGKDVESFGRSPEKPHFLSRTYFEECARSLTVEELRRAVYSEQVPFLPVDDEQEERERVITDEFTSAVLANFLLLPEMREDRIVKGYDGKPIGTSALFLETCLCAWLDKVGDRYIYKMAMSGSYDSDVVKYKRQLLKEAIEITLGSEDVSERIPEIIHAGLVRKASFRYMELMLNVSRILADRGVLDDASLGKLNTIKYDNLTVLQKLSILTGGAELDEYLQRTLEESNPTLGIILGNTFCCEKDAAYDLLKDTLRSLVDGGTAVEAIKPRVASIEFRLGESTKKKHCRTAVTGSGWWSTGYDAPGARDRLKKGTSTVERIVDGITVLERARDGSFTRKPFKKELAAYTKPACLHCVQTEPVVHILRKALARSFAAGEFGVVASETVLVEDRRSLDLFVTPSKERGEQDLSSFASSFNLTVDMSSPDPVDSFPVLVSESPLDSPAALIRSIKKVREIEDMLIDSMPLSIFDMPSPVSVISFPFCDTESPLDTPASLIRSIKKSREIEKRVKDSIVYTDSPEIVDISDETLSRRLFDTPPSRAEAPGTPKRTRPKSDKYLSPSFTPDNPRVKARVQLSSDGSGALSESMAETAKSLFLD